MTTLTKGANASLVLDGQPLRRVLVAVAWDAPTAARHPYDLDLAVVLGDANGHAPNPGHLVFAQQLAPPAPSAAVADAGARESGLLDLSPTPGGGLTFGGGGAPTAAQDDEELELDLAGVPGHVQFLAFVLTLHDGVSRAQTFADLRRVRLRIADLATGAEIAIFAPDLTGAPETSMVLAEVYRRTTPDGSMTWKVRAVGQGSSDGLSGVAALYGIER